MSRAIFRNHQNTIIEYLKKAQVSIHIAMCWFTNPFLFSILLRKAKSGIRIRLIVQFDQANFHPKGLPFFQFDSSEEKLRAYDEAQLLHHKFAIIDGDFLLTGSYNWTGTQHAENVLVVQDKVLLESYQSEFEKIWRIAKPLNVLSHKKPPQPAFQKLFKPIIWNVHDLRHAIILKSAKVWISVFKEEELLVWKQCLKLQRHFLKSKDDFFQQHSEEWTPTVFENWLQGLSQTRMRLLKNYCLNLKVNDLIITVNKNRKLLAAGMVGSPPEASHLLDYPYARFVQWFEFPEDIMLADPLPCNPFGKFRGSGLRVLSLLEKARVAA